MTLQLDWTMILGASLLAITSLLIFNSKRQPAKIKRDHNRR